MKERHGAVGDAKGIYVFDIINNTAINQRVFAEMSPECQMKSERIFMEIYGLLQVGDQKNLMAYIVFHPKVN